MNISSKQVEIQASDQQVFSLITDCNNIKEFIPNVQDWESTEDRCSFDVAGAGKVEIAIGEKIEFSEVQFCMGNAYAQGIIAVFKIKDLQNGSVTLQANTDVNVPFFIAQMLKAPLQKFIDLLVDQIKITIEKSYHA